ncbi:MAG TPA: hypothetical protein VK781_07595 [Solirubrobacteraceae bacterium]|jgi:hypothetical protein|nr:hypothetical protein [Solirubrobacteraceae bacterium]
MRASQWAEDEMKPERHHSDSHDPQPGRVRLREAKPLEVSEEPMKCVWSGYPNYDRDCRSRIPASFVIKAWQREMQLKGTIEGFFYFGWRNGVWLAFGQRDGGVRGIYCPTHCSERDSRGAQVEDRPTRRPMGIALR